MPPILDTRAWVPTPADPTVVYTTGAGVSGHTALQVTNNTLGELWINDSAVPPAAADAAKYVVPPRATAKLPLGGGSSAYRWNSLASGAADLVTSIFSDEEVTPQIIPGVNSVGGSAAPVQSVLIDTNNLGTLPITLTTTSGKNIGALHLYNNTSILWRITFALPSFKTISVRPYSWITVPVNQPSGTVTVNALSSLITGLFTRDSMYLSWSDVDYVLPTPVGAGLLPDPTERLSAAQAGALPLQQFTWRQELTAAGAITLGSIPANLGSVSRILITYIGLDVTAVGAAALGYVEFGNGYDGLGGAIIACALRPPAGAFLSTTRHDKSVLINLNAGVNSLVRLIASGGISSANAVVGGYILT